MIVDGARRHAVATPERGAIRFAAGRSALPIRLPVGRKQCVHRDVGLEHAIGKHGDTILPPQVREHLANPIKRFARNVGPSEIEDQRDADKLGRDLQDG